MRGAATAWIKRPTPSPGHEPFRVIPVGPQPPRCARPGPWRGCERRRAVAGRGLWTTGITRSLLRRGPRLVARHTSADHFSAPSTARASSSAPVEPQALAMTCNSAALSWSTGPSHGCASAACGFEQPTCASCYDTHRNLRLEVGFKRILQTLMTRGILRGKQAPGREGLADRKVRPRLHLTCRKARMLVNQT
jgi:hypothetical protein